MHRDKLNRHRHLDNTSVRIEISPAREESEHFTLEDWRQLAEEFVREFDAQDIRRKDGRREDGHTHLANSQYVVSLHRDSKGKILHLHINANRVDMDGNVNNSYMIGRRAVMAANRISERRGWVQSMQRREENIEAIHEACIDALRSMAVFDWLTYEAKLKAKGYDVKLVRSKEDKVVGYSIRKGNSTYKSSELGHSRELMPSKIESTWKRLHLIDNVRNGESSLFYAGDDDYFSTPAKPEVPQPKPEAVGISRWGLTGKRRAENKANDKEQPKQNEPTVQMPVMVHHDIKVDDKTYAFDIPKEADDIIMGNVEMPDDFLWSTLVDIQHTALLLFVNYLDAASQHSESCGGGGDGSTESGWGRKEDEDDIAWARRCAQQARIMHTRPYRMRR